MLNKKYIRKNQERKEENIEDMSRTEYRVI